MIITIKSLINGKVSTFKLSITQARDLTGDGDLRTFRGSVEVMFSCDVLAITHYI